MNNSFFLFYLNRPKSIQYKDIKAICINVNVSKFMVVIIVVLYNNTPVSQNNRKF